MPRGNVRVYIDGDATGLGRATKQAETHLGRLGTRVSGIGSKMTSAGAALNRGVTLPVVAIGAVAGKTAIDFDKSMRNVNSIAQLPEKNLKKLERSVLNLAGPTAQAPKTLAEGLYDLVSSGFNAKESLGILDKSARAATAGLTTTEVSTAAVAAELNAYHLPAKKAGQISDQLFETVNRGVISFEDLATNIGDVLPFAASLGVGMDQVGASISTMTKEGISAPETMTRLKNVMVTLLKPGKDLSKVLDSLGMSGEELVAKKGFQGALEAIISKTDGTKQSIAALFPNIRALGGVLALTGGNAQTAAADLSAFKDTSGATNRALSQQSKSLSYQWGKFRAELEETAIKAAPTFLSAGKEVIKDLGAMAEKFDSLSPATKNLIIKGTLLAAALGPVLTIGGNLLKVFGGIIRISDKVSTAFTRIGTGAATANAAPGAGAMGGGVGGAAAGTSRIASSYGTYSLARSFGRGRMASTVAQLGATGSAAATSFMGSFAKAVGPAAAVLGLGNILSSAMSGDMKEAGFKGGGALIGGIAGAFAGPEGAMLGAGIGSFIGGKIGDLFGGDGKSALQQQNEKTIRAAAAGRSTLVRSTHLVEQAEQRLSRIGDRQTQVQNRLKAAQDRLNEARKQGNTARVRREEARINELKAKQVNLVWRQYSAETHLHTARVKNMEDARRARSFEVNLVRTRQTQLEQAQKHERITRKAFEAAVNGNKPLKEQDERERDLIDAQKRRAAASQKLKGAEKELGGTMKEITQKYGKDFADQLRKQLPLWTATAGQTRKTIRAMHDLVPNIKPLTQVFEDYGKRAEDASKKAQKGSKELADKVPGQMGKVGRGYTNAATTGTRGLEVLGTNTNAMSKIFNAPELHFTLIGGGKGHAGGGMMRVPGMGRRDTVPLFGSGIRAMVAPGEDLIVANRHQRPELDFAVANTFGDRGLGGFFQRSRKLHYLAEGGFANKGRIREPMIAGADPLRAIGQGALGRIDKQAEAWLRKHMGPKGGLGTFDGKPVSAWIVPILAWARAHGWGGSLTSGYRTPAQQIAAATGYGLQHYGAAGPLGSNHVKINYPGGAIDVTQAAQLASILKGYPGKPNLVWGGPVMGDYVHFSATGHGKGGVARGRTGIFTPFEEKVRRAAGGAWNHAAHLYGHSPGDPMPMLYIAKGLTGTSGHVGDVRSAKGPYGHMVYLDRRWAGKLVGGNAYAKNTLLHEWAHVFQKQGLSTWEREGGATAFQRFASPLVYGGGPGPYPAGYRKYAERVKREKSAAWIQGGQFRGFAKGGIVKGGLSSLVGSSWDLNELATLAYVVGMDNPGLMAAVAWAESTGNAGAKNSESTATGLWQVLGGSTDPFQNAREAAELLKTQGLGAWAASQAAWSGAPKGTVNSGLARRLRALMGGGSVDPETVPVHGRTKLSYEEKISRLDTRLAKAETTSGLKDDRRAAIAKLDLMRSRKRYLEGKVVGINKKLKGKLKPPERERLLQQREGFLSELSSLPGEASGLIEGLRDAGLNHGQLKKAARGFGIGVADATGKITARDRADLQLARAEMTPGKADDIKALERLVKVSEKELATAKKSGDPRKLTEATRNLKEATDNLRAALPTAEDFANRDLALAELTEGTADDRAALEKLRDIAQQQLDAALATADPRDETEAAQRLKSLNDSLKSLTDTLTEIEAQRKAFEEERLATDKRLADLAENQGPAFAAAMLAWFDGALGGPVQSRGRLATAGVSAGYQ